MRVLDPRLIVFVTLIVLSAAMPANCQPAHPLHDLSTAVAARLAPPAPLAHPLVSLPR